MQRLEISEDEIFFHLDAAAIALAVSQMQTGDRLGEIATIDDRTLLKYAGRALGIARNPKGAMVFTSVYQSPTGASDRTLRTLVTLNGHVSLKIRRDFLLNPVYEPVMEEIIQVHQALVGHVLAQLPTAILNHLNSLLQPWRRGFMLLAIACFLPLLLHLWWKFTNISTVSSTASSGIARPWWLVAGTVVLVLLPMVLLAVAHWLHRWFRQKLIQFWTPAAFQIFWE